jgi:hypothetical protein
VGYVSFEGQGLGGVVSGTTELYDIDLQKWCRFKDSCVRHVCSRTCICKDPQSFRQTFESFFVYIFLSSISQILICPIPLSFICNQSLLVAPLHTISHPPQNRLSLLHILVVVNPQAIRQQKRWEIGVSCILSCSIRVLDLRWVGSRHRVEAAYL